MFLQRYGRRMAVAFPLLFTVACDESARSAVASTEVDSAGVRIISSIAPAWGERGSTSIPSQCSESATKNPVPSSSVSCR